MFIVDSKGNCRKVSSDFVDLLRPGYVRWVQDSTSSDPPLQEVSTKRSWRRPALIGALVLIIVFFGGLAIYMMATNEGGGPRRDHTSSWTPVFVHVVPQGNQFAGTPNAPVVSPAAVKNPMPRTPTPPIRPSLKTPRVRFR